MTIRKRVARIIRRLTGVKPPLPVIPPPGPVAVTTRDGLVLDEGGSVARGADRYFYLGPEQALVRLNCGHVLYVDPMDEHVSANIILDGVWENWVHKVVVSLVTPGARIVEVGANLGYYTVIMAGAAGPTGSVLTLEANPRLAEMVTRSALINGFASRVKVIAKAALDQPGAITFSISRRNSGGGFVNPWGTHHYADGEELEVEAVRIDDLDPGKVDFLRMDAEGSEAFILRGAEATLRANPDIVICMEWSVQQIGSRTSVPDFIDWMVGLGFKFWRIGYDSSLTAVTIQDLAGLDHCDLVVSRNTPQTA